MLIAVLGLVIMLALLDRSTRIAKLELLKFETKMRLFSLRDQLRMAAINQEVPCNSVFEYLDTTITASMNSLNEINLWGGLALLYTYGKDQSLLETERRLFERIMEKENAPFLRFYFEHLACLVLFIWERHSAFENAYRTARAVGIVLKWLHKLRVESIQIFYRAPKTSTVFRYNQ